MSSFVTRTARRFFCAAVRPGIRQNVPRSTPYLERVKSEALKGARKGDIGLIVKSIRSVQNVSKAEKLGIFRNVLEICAQRGDAKTAARVFKSMEECKIKVDDVCRNHIVDAYANFAAHFSTSSSSSDQKTERPREEWDHLAGHRLIMANFAKSGDVRGAKSWIDNKISMPDAECIAHLCHAHLKARDDCSASSIWDSMVSRGITPTLRAYTIVLNALAQRCERKNAILVQQCIQWFDRIAWEGKFTPNVAAYNMMIQAHVNKGDSKGACGWFDKLLAAKLAPNEVSYNMILKSFANAGDPLRAMQVLDNMESSQLQPNQVSFSTVLDAFARSTDPKAASRYIEKLQSQDSSSNGSSSSSSKDQADAQDTREFTKRLVNANDSVATSILERMNTASIKPHLNCWNTIIRAVAKTGDISRTKAWLEKMQSARCIPDLYSYNSVFAVFNRRADVLAAEQWMENIKNKRFQPDLVSVNSLLHVKALASDSVGAVQTFDEYFSNSKLRADEKSYSNVIDAFSKAGDPQNALKWLQKLQNAGFKVDIVGHTAMLDAYIKSGDVTSAIEYFETNVDANHAKSNLDRSIFSSLLDGLAKFGLAEQAVTWLDRMQNDYGVRPCAACYAHVISAYAKNHDYVGAKNIFSRMEQANIKPNEACWMGLVHSQRKVAAAGETEGRVLEKMIHFSKPERLYRRVLYKSIFEH